MRRPRIRGHIVLVLLWVGAGLAAVLVSLRDARTQGQRATDLVPYLLVLILLWCLIGGMPFYYYRKYRGSKDPSEYGLAQFLRDYDWPDE